MRTHDAALLLWLLIITHNTECTDQEFKVLENESMALTPVVGNDSLPIDYEDSNTNTNSYNLHRYYVRLCLEGIYTIIFVTSTV